MSKVEFKTEMPPNYVKHSIAFRDYMTTNGLKVQVTLWRYFNGEPLIRHWFTTFCLLLYIIDNYFSNIKKTCQRVLLSFIFGKILLWLLVIIIRDSSLCRIAAYESKK